VFSAALSSAPKPERHNGKVVWAELVTPDLAGAERFYGALFGWTFRAGSADGHNYALALQGDQPVADLAERPLRAGEHRQSSWLTFIATPDVDAVRSATLRGGGKMLTPPRNWPDRGREAVFADPEGAVFGVITTSAGDTPDFLAEPGEWIWSALLVKNPDRDAAFYRSVFGYDVTDLPGDDRRRHLVLSNEDFARVGLNQLPADSRRRHPHWLEFVRVESATDTANKAVALGARVLVDPRVDRHGGKLSVIADPWGAPFGVMEWSLGDSQEQLP
jgi:predicted enzyme related to lactoylglutathione lyase